MIRTNVGGNTLITIGANTITLIGVLPGAVTATDFILAPQQERSGIWSNL